LTLVHIMAGLEPTSGVANVARRFVRVQRERGDAVDMLAPSGRWNPVYFDFAFAWKAWRAVRSADEVWVHCSWTFPVWYGAWLARRYGRKLVVVPEASFDPKRMHNHAGWKKRLVSPIDRWVIRSASEVLALCPDEVEWVKAFEPRANVRYAQVPVFYEGVPLASDRGNRGSDRSLHVLFLGRAEDPLKGLAYLERAVAACGPSVALRVVSDHTGEALERDWDWCDVLCLPTLSDNFGLVVAEALERGKRVITTDGASAWGACGLADGRLVYLTGYRDGTDAVRVTMLREALGRMAT